MKDFPTIKKLKSSGIDGTQTLESTGLGISAKTVDEVEEEQRPKSVDELANSLADKAEKVTKGDGSSKAAEIRARAALVRAKAKKVRDAMDIDDEAIDSMVTEMPKTKKK